MTFQKYDYSKILEINFSEYDNVDIYFTYEWLKYLKEAMKVEPFIVEIKDLDKIIGYFVGCSFKKFFVKMVGSPFRGWNTPYMGLILKPSYSRIDVLKELWPFIKKEFKCTYMEVCDRNITKEEVDSSKFPFIIEKTYYMDITPDEETLLASFTKHCRKDLRVFTNRGASVKKVDYNDEFLEELYIMLEEVFRLQGLKPPYSKSKLKTILENVKDENRLCIKAFDPDNNCIGISTCFGFNDFCYAFASATKREYNYNQKNAMRWFAIRYWKNNGKKFYDLMGIRNYKLEFNPMELEYYRICFTKFKILIPLRNAAKKIYWILNKIRFKLKI